MKTPDTEIQYHAKDLETLRNKYSKYINSKNILEFKGTLVEGPEISLSDLSGLELTYSDSDKIWTNINPRDALEEYLDCEEFELYEIDESPMHSDVYYEYYCGDFDEFISKLRTWILDYLRNKN
jgi:hypothetical protein